MRASAARDMGASGDATAQRLRTMLADPRMAAAARAVRPAGAGLLVTEVEKIPVVAAEAVHDRIARTGALELYGRLRPLVLRPGREAMFVEVQKLRGELGPVRSFGWLVITRPAGNGFELQAFLTAEIGFRSGNEDRLYARQSAAWGRSYAGVAAGERASRWSPGGGATALVRTHR